MSATNKRLYSEAFPVAQKLVGKLAPYCERERIEIAGSLRRGRPTIGDIELVALPAKVNDLFGNVTDGNTQLDYFLARNTVPMIKNGAKYKQFKYAGYNVDLFLPESPAHWGCIFLLRTGSHDFNLWLMNTVQHRAGVRFDKGRLLRGGVLLDTPEETDVLDALGLPWIPPNYRDDHKWLELIKEPTV